MEPNKTISVSNRKNWTGAIFLVVVSIIFIIAGNFLYGAFLSIAVLMGQGWVSNAVVLVRILFILFSFVMMWLAILSVKGDFVKRRGSYDPAKVATYASILLFIYIPLSLISSVLYPAQGFLTTNIIFGLIRIVASVLVFYFLAKHYLTIYSNSVPTRVSNDAEKSDISVKESGKFSYINALLSVASYILVFFTIYTSFQNENNDSMVGVLWLVSFILYVIGVFFSIRCIKKDSKAVGWILVSVGILYLLIALGFIDFLYALGQS